MSNYIIQTIAFQVFFLLIYDLFLRKETFFNWNRVYLIITALLSFILPFIKIDSFKTLVSNEYIIRLPELIIGESQVKETTTALIGEWIIDNSSISILSILLIIGMIITFVLFIVKLLHIFYLINKNLKIREDNITIIKLANSNTAFSFFNYVFIGDNLNSNEALQIICHEKIHVQQNHTLDLLFFEMIRILFWFNPLVYMYQNRIASLHEYIADSEAIKFQNKKHYYESLLTQVLDVKNVSFTNTFFKKSLIKKRLIMLSKSKSKQILKLKYAIIIPVIFGMLIYSSCAQSVSYESAIAQHVAKIKDKLAKKGNVSDIEAQGLDILYRSMNSTTNKKNVNVVADLQSFMATLNPSDAAISIMDLFEEIQKQGNISDADEKSIKSLLVLTTKDGLKDPLFADVIEDVEIPYDVIQKAPTHKSCSDLKENKERKECMAKNLNSFVGQNFNLDLAEELNLKGIQDIKVNFIIDNKGNIKDITAKSESGEMEKEAIRVIKLLPQMDPGYQDGIAINVPYILPIKFKIND